MITNHSNPDVFLSLTRFRNERTQHEAEQGVQSWEWQRTGSRKAFIRNYFYLVPKSSGAW